MHKALHFSGQLLILAFGLALVPAFSVAYVASQVGAREFEDAARVPPERVAIVLGAGVYSDGSPTPMLAARVRAAVELYVAGRVQKLLMTGDNSRPEYDEVTAMKKYAVALGVPERDITLDYAGFNTYDSCYRAREIFGVTRAIVVTQNFHLSRALYTCRQLGIQAVGFGTPDWGVYPSGLMWAYSVREAFATTKALWDLNVSRPLPTFLGPYEGVG
ncbi:MAG TPA: ElyC/SanA/YdcF family protein [Anaerolineae bacterium]